MADKVKKNKEGYGYKYTDLAQIHDYLESTGQSYYQYIETDDIGNDYIMTVPIKDGKELPVRRGCRVIQATLSGKSNPAQEQGSALTYARRYSLLMAFGLATEDDDAAALDKPKQAKAKALAQPVKQTVNKGIGPTKAKALAELLTENGIMTDFVCDMYGVNNLATMTEAKHKNVLEHIEDIKKMQEEKK